MLGVSMRAVQELLGHAKIQMTEHYAHLAPRVKRDAVLLLDASAERSSRTVKRQGIGKSSQRTRK